MHFWSRFPFIFSSFSVHENYKRCSVLCELNAYTLLEQNDFLFFQPILRWRLYFSSYTFGTNDLRDLNRWSKMVMFSKRSNDYWQNISFSMPWIPGSVWLFISFWKYMCVFFSFLSFSYTSIMSLTSQTKTMDKTIFFAYSDCIGSVVDLNAM